MYVTTARKCASRRLLDAQLPFQFPGVLCIHQLPAGQRAREPPSQKCGGGRLAVATSSAGSRAVSAQRSRSAAAVFGCVTLCCEQCAGLSCNLISWLLYFKSFSTLRYLAFSISPLVLVYCQNASSSCLLHFSVASATCSLTLSTTQPPALH